MANPNSFLFTFDEPGDYSITLFVKRCEFIFPPLEHRVRVLGPPFILPDELFFCPGENVLELKAIDDRFANPDDFDIVWSNSAGLQLGTGNILPIRFPEDFINPTVGEIFTVTAAALKRNGIDTCPPVEVQIFIGAPRELGLQLNQVLFVMMEN
ncbi:hypothetical protein [Nitritalea halalkaliphila]|nr:hypothetical protein [Nitritalea halalkaliphila]